MYAYLVLLTLGFVAVAQNRAPQFDAMGDMLDLAIREDTRVGNPVYNVKATDPDGDKVFYSISGDFFSIDRLTGQVKLVKPVDRERMRSVEVILTITDEATSDREPNIVSVRRLVPVVDANDNPPIFNGLESGAYRFSVSETAEVGSTVFSKVNVTDADFGMNGEVSLMCDSSRTPEACRRFDVRGVRLDSGVFLGIVALRAALDYETEKSFVVGVLATDSGKPQLTATARMIISVEDVQDQPPEFVNGPFSATVSENTPPGTPVLDIIARDGDTGIPRELRLEIIGDEAGYFQLQAPTRGPNGVYTTKLVTGNTTLDRENPTILEDVGLYHFQLKAEEVVPGGGSGDDVITEVTVVVGDEDDQDPTFNKEVFNVFIPEDTRNGTPLPGLDMIVSDSDEGEGSRFDLRLEDIQNSAGVFEIYPTSAEGRAPVLVKVADSSKLNYESEVDRQFMFAVVASQGETEVRARVIVLVTDANDNAPQFPTDSFKFKIEEDAVAGKVLGTVRAKDKDSGDFGKIRYRLRGFGAEKFHIDRHSGKLSLADCPYTPCLDYEDKSSYSLAVVAKDGGNRTASASLIIDVQDVNDNRPEFLEREYRRTLEEGATEFFPRFFVKAKDLDENGNAPVLYDIIEGNHDNMFSIDPQTGQIMVQGAALHNRTEVGRIELVVQAKDTGDPPLTENVRVFISIGRDTNEPPVFRSSPFEAAVKETASAGDVVLAISANDPDGEDSDLHYYIQRGAADNFEINQAGEILISEGARLDLEKGGSEEYQLVVHAVDQGDPAKTGTAAVTITIADVNDAPPVFKQKSFVEYVPEDSEPGSLVETLTASDPDSNASLRYHLLTPVTARDRAGVNVPSNGTTDFSTWFAIDHITGQLTVNASLDHSLAAVILCRVRATDINAEVGEQFDTADLTLFIQAFSDNNPVFEAPWLPTQPKIDVDVPEEGQPGSTIYTLRAKDPVSSQAVTRYEEIVGSDDEDWFSVDERVGEIMINRRLDFDTMEVKSLSVRVRAISGQRSSQALVTVRVTDINDNFPLFGKKSYESSVSEESYFPTVITTISARDIDSENGYGNVTYSLAGTTSDQFFIDPLNGTLHVARGVRLDRETNPVHRLRVVAQDNPRHAEQPNRSYAQLTITVLDENDNRPEFTEDTYTAVVAENVPHGTQVIRISATDKDEGKNGNVSYSVVDEGQAKGLFELDENSGEIKVRADLAGKGRTAPYRLTVRAQDQGSEPLLSDATLEVFIGDVSINDGIPRFLRPEPGEEVSVLENLPAGASVFQARASDPDDPLTPSGSIKYSFLGSDRVSKDGNFEIDSRTGVIRTREVLDREETAEYTLLLLASDQGQPPQQTTRTLKVRVTDVDDNEPRFRRARTSQPKEVVVTEEVGLGTVVTTLRAEDGDAGAFGRIDYIITAGDPEKVFAFKRTDDNAGELIVASRLDREDTEEYLLTVRCVRDRTELGQRIQYDPDDLSMIQLRITVLDVDDNPPIFSQANITTGVKVSTPVRTVVATLSAVDPDVSPAPVRYAIEDTTFSRHLRSSGRDEMLGGLRSFVVDDVSGQVWTNEVMSKYSGGYFDIYASAMSAGNPDRKSEAYIRVYVLQESDLMKFVFRRPPGEVKERLTEFQNEVEDAVPAPVALNLYDTSYYSLPDGRLDFTSTGSCFQIVAGGDIYTADEAAALLDTSVNTRLEKLFQQYRVDGIEPCLSLPGGAGYQFSVVEVLVMAIGVIVILGALIAILALQCYWKRYRRERRRRVKRYSVQEVTIPTPVVASSLPPGSRVPSVAEGNYVIPQHHYDRNVYGSVPGYAPVRP